MEFPIYDYLYKNHSISFTDQQKQAVETIIGSVLLLAVPGAGKTTVMVTRIANMILNHDVNPKEILTITFSKSGAEDMKARFKSLFQNAGNVGEPAFSTIHSFCRSVLSSYCQATRGQMPNLIENKEKKSILRDLYKKATGDFLTDDLEDELSSCLGYLKNAMLKEEEADKVETEIKHLWKLYRSYDEQKKKNGLMDFDDMLSYALTVFRRYPDILAQYRSRYRYICLDEAQDTSKLQHMVIRLLAAPENNLFLVGDEDQSIYGFRGALPEHLLNFQKNYPNASVLKIEENFRSSKNIVERANIFIGWNKKRYPKTMCTRNPQGEKIDTPKLSNIADQYRIVLDRYLSEPGTTAVIYRNNISAIPLVDILDRNHVEFTIKDQKTSFRNNYVVGDVLAFLDLSFDKENLQAFSRIFYKTSGFLKRNMLLKLNTVPLNKGETYFDRMIILCEERGNTGKIRYIASMIDALKRLPPAKALDKILNSIGYLDFLEYSSGTGFSTQVQKLGVLQSLATRVKSVEEFMQRVQEMDSVVKTHSQRSKARLTLTTAHSAKGLEFDSVVILDLMEDVFPTHSAVDKLKQGMLEEMEEEARLFYVACTRARKRLVLPYSNFSDGNTITPSRFISRLMQEPVKAKKTGNLKADEESQGLYPGLMIMHNFFGEGQVVSIDRVRRTFNVFFVNSGTKTLTMDILSKGAVILKPH